MLKKGSAAAKAFMAKIRAKKGKKPATKKAATKKALVKKVGALPVGFEGKIFETTFKIINQFDIFNNVQSIVEDKKNGSTITVFDGKGSAADKAKQFANYVENYAYPDSRLSESDYKALYGKILKFSQNMQNEVKEYNKGSKKTIKKQPLNIPLPAKKKRSVKRSVKTSVKQTGASNKERDKMLQALPAGKRKSASGKTYYEYRANRSDKGKLLGIKIGNMPTYNDKEAAREIQLYADNDYQLYNQRKRPILINLGKKYKKGTYDVQKAAKLWRYYIDAAMQKYHKEFGSRGDKWYELLNVADRNLLALEYAMETKEEFDLGNFTS
jgi:hypothetical protein